VKLLLATHNQHKLREFRQILGSETVIGLSEQIVLPEETGDTFAENALLKARAAATATGMPAIADDSGIEAAALGGAPGVNSARYAGPNATDAQNLDKLIAEIPVGSRLAYVCVIAYVNPASAIEQLFQGRCEGEMSPQARGKGGFGYDPIFIPEDINDERTMAQLTSAEKDAISHRGRAIGELLAWLKRKR
jgi:XTP/dITP diphosphohydrolase